MSARTRMNRMIHTQMVCAIKELFHNAKTNNDNNQPVGKVVSQKQECYLRQPRECQANSSVPCLEATWGPSRQLKTGRRKLIL